MKHKSIWLISPGRPIRTQTYAQIPGSVVRNPLESALRHGDSEAPLVHRGFTPSFRDGTISGVDLAGFRSRLVPDHTFFIEELPERVLFGPVSLRRFGHLLG